MTALKFKTLAARKTVLSMWSGPEISQFRDGPASRSKGNHALPGLSGLDGKPRCVEHLDLLRLVEADAIIRVHIDAWDNFIIEKSDRILARPDKASFVHE